MAQGRPRGRFPLAVGATLKRRRDAMDEGSQPSVYHTVRCARIACARARSGRAAACSAHAACAAHA